MKLSRAGVERYRPRPTTTPAVPDVSAWKLSIDGGVTWVACDVMTDEIPSPGEPTWLLAGPNAASPGSATVVPDCEWITPDLDYPNSPQQLVRRAPAVFLV